MSSAQIVSAAALHAKTPVSNANHVTGSGPQSTRNSLQQVRLLAN